MGNSKNMNGSLEDRSAKLKVNFRQNFFHTLVWYSITESWLFSFIRNKLSSCMFEFIIDAKFRSITRKFRLSLFLFKTIHFRKSFFNANLMQTEWMTEIREESFSVKLWKFLHNSFNKSMITYDGSDARNEIFLKENVCGLCWEHCEAMVTRGKPQSGNWNFRLRWAFI